MYIHMCMQSSPICSFIEFCGVQCGLIVLVSLYPVGQHKQIVASSQVAWSITHNKKNGNRLAMRAASLRVKYCTLT